MNGDLAIFDLYVWKIRDMVQVALRSTSSSHSKFHVDVDGSIADVSVSGASDGVEQRLDIGIINAVRKVGLAKRNVTMIDDAQSYTSVPGKACV